MRSIALGVALLSAGFTAAAGAQSSVPAPGKPGFVHVTFTGGLNASFRGTAMLTSAGEGGVMINLSNDGHADNDGVMFTRNKGGIPKVGTYSLTNMCVSSANAPDDTQFRGGFTWEGPTGGDIAGNSCTGSLTITSASPDVVKGEFRFTADASQDRGEDTPRQFHTVVSGQFIAAGILTLTREP